MPHPSRRSLLLVLPVLVLLLLPVSASSATTGDPHWRARLVPVLSPVVRRSSPAFAAAHQLAAEAAKGVRLHRARVLAARMRAIRLRRQQLHVQRLRKTFTAGHLYLGTFADPSVIRVGRTYVAYGTTTGRDNLPVMTSRSLRRWHTRPALPKRRVTGTGRNDSMPVKPRWAVPRPGGPRNRISLWAPSAAKVGRHVVVAYAAAVRLHPHKACIGIATSSSPTGPFLDRHRAPLVCYHPSVRGAIDPDVFVDPRTHAPYLLWKNEGIPHVHPSRLMVRRLNRAGTRFARGSVAVRLLQTDRRWEGRVIENPAMTRYRGHLYLFYSGNYWFTRRYAVGYARCATPVGPCVRASRPLIVSGHGMAGPGGADPFVDRSGRLRLAYAAWDSDRVGPGPGHRRRLHVATLRVRRHGALGVLRLF